MFDCFQSSRLSPRLRWWCLFVFSLAICGGTLGAKTAKLSGIVFTLGSDQVQTVWPNAKITLKSLASNEEVSNVSNDLGQYSFIGILAGEYEISVHLAGFEVLTKRVTLDADKPNQLDLQLTPEKRTESVTRYGSGQRRRCHFQYFGQPTTLTTNVLKSVVRLNSDFQDALPLLPSVVRGPDGLIHVKGGQPIKPSALVNNASIADPVTGQPALRLRRQRWNRCACSPILFRRNMAASAAA